MSAKIHVLRQQQWIHRPIHDVFEFFSQARNLERLTPPWLNFRILSSSTQAIGEGTRIRYRLGLHGVPINWLTEIRHWNPPHRFVDWQQSGPYKLWHHTHIFEEHEENTLMKDIVRYTLPFGLLGRVVHALKVQKDVQKIFEYRREQIMRSFDGA